MFNFCDFRCPCEHDSASTTHTMEQAASRCSSDVTIRIMTPLAMEPVYFLNNDNEVHVPLRE